MKNILKYVGWGFALIVLVALGVWLWAHQVATSRYAQQWTVHKADFPIPFPLQDGEVPAGTDPQAAALESAIKRGKHLVEARVACNGCHGNDFGGAAVVDVPLVAHWVAPNLTTG